MNDTRAHGNVILSLRDVGIQYRVDGQTTTAVTNVSLDVAAAHRLVLLGPSGCGKSSLLKAIGGFIPHHAGSITLKGQAVNRPSPQQVMVFQEFDQLFPWKTVLGNVVYPLLRVHRMSRAEAVEKARRMLKRVGLERAVDQYPHTLSGGMKQRAAIARSFVIEPDVLLMDEPFAALDAMNRRRMQELLLSLCEETHATVVFVSHAVDEALLLGTDIALLSAHPGRVIRTFAFASAPEKAAVEKDITALIGRHDEELP